MPIPNFLMPTAWRPTHSLLPGAATAVPPAPTFAGATGPLRQAGVVTVEFALIAAFAFVPLLLAEIELGRLFYLVTTTQEVTRRAAREQVVRWTDQTALVQRHAFFHEAGSGSTTLPGGLEIQSTDVRLEFYGSYADARNQSNRVSGVSATENLANCIRNVSPCIRYVRASLQTARGDQLRYRPMTGWFGELLNVPLPEATVIMPAEALGVL